MGMITVLNGVRLDFEAPSNGWVDVRLNAAGVLLEYRASYTPRDSIGDLARAADLSLAGGPEQVVVWNTEPAEYEFRFTTSAGRTRLEVRRFPDLRRRHRNAEPPIASTEDQTPAIALAVWRALRRLQGAMSADEFRARWGHPFPAGTVARLGERLKGGISCEH